MHDVNLRSVDLNLLIVLHSVLTERHITRAAARLNMSQPAVSHALGRLRYLFKDPLLVRCGHEMILTTRAGEIAGNVEVILANIAEVLERPNFDPALATGRIAICATEGAIGVLGDALLHARSIASSVMFEFTSERIDIESRLRSGEVDLHVDTQPMQRSNDFHSAELLRNALKCVMRNAEMRRDPITREEYEAHAHVVVAGGTNDRLGFHLRQMSINRNIAMIVSGYLSAASLVSKSNLLLTLPAALAAHACKLFPLYARDFAFDVPEIVLTMTWHTRRENNPLHRWIREMLVPGADGTPRDY